MPNRPPIADIRAKAKDFYGQFLLCLDPPDIPEGWAAHRHGRWHLLSHPSLPVIPLLAPDGSPSGFALGHPIGPDGRVAPSPLRLPHHPVAKDPSQDDIEPWIYTFGGRYAFILLTDATQRAYLDPGGTLAAVWCPARRRLASTPSLLLLDEPDHPMFRIRRGDFPLTKPLQFFPAGLTAADGVTRLLANHYLDLRDWRDVRHYPSAPYEYVPESQIPDQIAAFHAIVRRQIGAAIEHCGGAYLALTAGEDSRRILACARDFIDRIECITLARARHDSRVASEIDVLVPTRLAKKVGFRHRVLTMGVSDRNRLADYVLRIGYSGGPGKAPKFSDPFIGHLDMSRALFTGHCGHMAKAKYADQLPGMAMPTPKSILKDVHLSPRPEFAEAVDRWLAGLPEGSPAFYRDMSLLEVGVSGWVATHFYGFAPFRMLLSPFCHRDAIDAMFRLPPQFRTGGNVARAVLELAWPELLCLPFNECTGFKRLEHRARRWLRRTTKTALSRLRKARDKKSTAPHRGRSV